MGLELVYGVFGRRLQEVLRAHGVREPRVSPKLRGWRYRERPVKPRSKGSLPLSAVASDFCPRGRDVYLRYVERVELPPSPPALSGSIYHEVFAEAVTRAKRAIYEGVGERFLEELLEQGEEVVEGLLERARGLPELQRVRSNALKLWRFEVCQIASAVGAVLARAPWVGADSLVAHALPLVVEHRLEGSKLGLSKQLSVDAFQALRGLVMEMKTGRERGWHRLALAGYALALESSSGRPVDFGMVAYVRFPEGSPVPQVIRRVYPLGDGPRERFLRARDEKLEILGGRDPGVPRRCPSSCGYFRVCHG